jgi:hypothetical protein
MTPEEHERQYRVKLDAWSAEQDARKPMFDAAIRYSEMAIRSLLLISGGAAVALAGFAGGSLKADAHPAVLIALSSSVWWFALSAVGAVAVAGLSYLTQIVILEAPEPWNDRIGGLIRALAVLLFIACLGFFLMGAYAASSALQPIPTK